MTHPRLRTVLSIVVLLVAAAGPGAAQTITRIPYLQRGSATQVTVRWRTDVATDSEVRYGPAPAMLTSTVSDPSLTTEHVVVLTGLSADTRYYYSVGTTGGPLAGGDSDHTFLTAPTAGKPTRIWVIGDSGTANANSIAVRDAYDAFPGSAATDLWLMLGDNAYTVGTDANYQAAVFNIYQRLLRSSVLWPTFGNHEGFTADSNLQSGPYYDIFTLPTLAEAGGVASGTEAYYSFDYGNIHFICLNSHDIDRSPAGAMLTWLTLDLQATTADWIIAFFHHPPYTKGSHNSDIEVQLIEMRQNALPILEDYGVDLVLTGHSHSYERSFLVDGHYGNSTTLAPTMLLDSGDGRSDGDGAYRKWSLTPAGHGGAVYAVAGSSGQISGGSLDHPVKFISLNELGSLVLDIDGPELNAQFLNDSGVVRDHFTIHKAAALCPPAPRSGCRATPRSILRMIDHATNDNRDRVVWKGRKAPATVAELGDPESTTDYGLCIYDQNGAVFAAQLGASAMHWSPSPGGFEYDDPDGNVAGIERVKLKGDVGTRTKLLVDGAGPKVAPAAGPYVLPVTAQLVNGESGLCWEAVYTSEIKNTGSVFKARLP